MNYTLTVEHNEVTDEYYFILPEKLLQEVGWKQGDKISWKKDKDGSFILKKVK